MRVLRYTLRRLLFMVPVLLGALFLTFALTRIVPGNPIDRVAGVSIPIFWLGLMLLYFFFYKLSWFPGPVGRTGSATTQIHSITGIYTLDTLLRGDWSGFVAAVKALALPCLTLGFVAMAPI